MVKLVKMLIMVSIGLLLNYAGVAQHSYVIKITPTTSQVMIDSCIKIFNDLSIKNCVYVAKSDIFLVEAKNFLPKLILVDYFGGYGFSITEWSEDIKKAQMYIIPSKKD
jgi:hypothetical protein